MADDSLEFPTEDSAEPVEDDSQELGPDEGRTFVGRQTGSYEILSLLGRGGMGEVYRARDTTLGREVAIKVLPASFSDDRERLARFEREARLLAALNHPHIGAIHGIEEIDGVRALILELIEGATLADRPLRGPIAIPEALTIARQICEALEAAHEAGIIHRDLKPGNIKVRPDGYVKVLDFGLAKGLAVSGPNGDLTPVSDLTAAATSEGVILGTPAYMSPEQARGQSVDKRTDIWAFGCVLFEMLTGRSGFEGSTIPDTLAAVLEGEPDWTSLPGGTPPTIRRLLRRCLEKDPRRRLHDIADARIEIEDALAPSDPADFRAILSSGGARRWIPWAVASVAFAIAAGAAALYLTAPPTRTPTRDVQVRRLTDLVGLEEAPAVSPDGRMVAFVRVAGAHRQIWVQLLAGGAPLAVTQDEVDHYGPRWSPDSGSLIYYTPGDEPGGPGTIWEIPALGGSARRLVDALGPGDLSHDGASLAFLRFSEGSIELATAARDGTGARVITRLPTGKYYPPRWSPDDRRLATVQESGGATFATNLLAVDVTTGASQRVLGTSYFQGVSWTADGSALIASSAQSSLMSYPPTYDLWLVPLDGGAASQLTFGESSYEFPDVADGGQLVVSRVHQRSDVWMFPVTGDPANNARQGVRITRQTGLVQTVSVSPDDSEVVFLSDNGGHANVWIAGTSDGRMRPVTRETDPGVVVAVPVWSPRGDWINYLSNRNSGSPDVSPWLIKPDGSDARDLGILGAWTCWSGDGERVYLSVLEADVYRIAKVAADGGQPVRVRDDNAIGCQVTPDGSALYYARIFTQATGTWDFEIRRAEPEDAPSEVLGRVAGARVPSGAINFHALLSPDGRWLAMPLLDGSTTNLWALSTAGGEWRQLTDFGERNVMIARRIAWSRDGRYIYASVSDVDSDVVMLDGLLK